MAYTLMADRNMEGRSRSYLWVQVQEQESIMQTRGRNHFAKRQTTIAGLPAYKQGLGLRAFNSHLCQEKVRRYQFDLSADPRDEPMLPSPKGPQAFCRQTLNFHLRLMLKMKTRTPAS